MTKVCILTSSHPPFDTRIFVKEAQSLVAAGYEVTLVVPHADAASRDGVRVVTVRPPRGRWDRWLRTPWRVLSASRGLGANVYHLHDPELMPVALWLGLRGAKVVYDVHEDLPKDLLAKAYLPLWGRRVLAWMVRVIQRFVARRCALIVVARDDIAKGVMRGIPCVVVSNYPPVALAESAVVATERGGTGPLRLAYVGSMSPVRGVEEMVRALERLPAGISATIDLYGKFSPESFGVRVLGRAGAAHVRHHGHVAYEEVGARLAEVDAGIVCFLPVPNNVNSGPTKLFEYMACGLPVVVSDFPEWRKVVDGTGCGVCVDPTNPDDIARGIATLARAGTADRVRMGWRGREAVLAGLNWETEAARLIDAYRRLVLP